MEIPLHLSNHSFADRARRGKPRLYTKFGVFPQTVQPCLHLPAATFRSLPRPTLCVKFRRSWQACFHDSGSAQRWRKFRRSSRETRPRSRALTWRSPIFPREPEAIFAASELNESEAMIELSRRLNLEIMRAARGVRSCPAFAGCYNEELGTVCYVNAGHTPGLLRDDESVVELPATGLPLGLFSLAPTDARIVGLGPKGSLAVVSRGVVEAESKKMEFGLDGVKSILQAGPASAKDLSQRILQGVQNFMHMAPKPNDVTALTLTRGN